MTPCDACTSRTSRVLTVASLHRLKMEALIPAPANCEMHFVIKFLNAQSIVPIEIHCHLCQVYGPNFISKQMVRRWCRRFTAGHPSLRTTLWSLCGNLVPSDFHLLSHLKKFLSDERQHFQNDTELEMNVTKWFQSEVADIYDTRTQKFVPRYDKCLNSRGEYV